MRADTQQRHRTYKHKGAIFGAHRHVATRRCAGRAPAELLLDELLVGFRQCMGIVGGNPFGAPQKQHVWTRRMKHEPRAGRGQGYKRGWGRPFPMTRETVGREQRNGVTYKQSKT